MRPLQYFTNGLFLLSIACFQAVEAQRNVTIDDIDARINYQPREAWYLSAPTELNAGGAHMLTSTPGASATFTFKGTAIYFMSPLWPYHVTTALQLDNRDPDLLVLVDRSRPDTGGGPETVQSSIVWSATGLDDTEHRLLIYVGDSEPFAIVDTLIYTTFDSDDSGTGGGGDSGSSGDSTGDGSSNGTDGSSDGSGNGSSDGNGAGNGDGTGNGSGGEGSGDGSGDNTGGGAVPLPSDSNTHTITAVPTPTGDGDGTALGSNSSSDDDGPNVLAIVLGVIFGILGLLLLLGLLWLCLRKRRQDRMQHGGPLGFTDHSRDSSEEPDYRIRDSAAPIAGYYPHGSNVSRVQSRNQDPSIIGDYPPADSHASYPSRHDGPYPPFHQQHQHPGTMTPPGMAGVGAVGAGAGAGAAAGSAAGGGGPVSGPYSRHSGHSESSDSSVTTYLHQQPAVPPPAVVESRVSSRYHNTLSIITESSNPSLNRSLRSEANSVTPQSSFGDGYHRVLSNKSTGGSLDVKRSGGSGIGRQNSGYQLLDKGKGKEVIPADEWETVPAAPPTSRF
ncbi:hypothetical protein AX16_007193 [Volvariella volvacea WC 439]|nr:hypothetical protein AX16_007193 [Volvariella volvacea WC 439]